jgi:CrcB protein
MTVLLVALGAALGAPLRYLTDRAVRARTDSVFPWGTFTVNITGSALLGFLIALPAGGAVMAAAGTGFCGALTTYSSFAVQTCERGPRLGTATALLTVPPALVLCTAGFLLGA